MNAVDPVLQQIVNRRINIAYILAGCFSLACEDMFNGLEEVKSDLNQENKKLVKELMNTSKRVQYLVNRLDENSILKKDITEDTLYLHDDAVFKYYATLIKIIQISGSDYLTPVRLTKVYDILCTMRDKINMGKSQNLEHMAFKRTRLDILQGKYKKEEVRTCIEMIDYDEYKSKTLESKA
jgi:hypothetical protein